MILAYFRNFKTNCRHFCNKKPWLPSFLCTRNWIFFSKLGFSKKLARRTHGLALFAYPPDQIMKLQLQIFKGNRWKSQITMGLTKSSELRSKNQNFLILFWQLSGLKELNSIVNCSFLICYIRIIRYLYNLFYCVSTIRTPIEGPFFSFKMLV